MTFDKQALLQKLGGDEEFVRSLLGVALRATSRTPDDLRAACAVADFESMARLAHQVKGTAGDLVAEDLRLRAREAEFAARSSDPGAVTLNLELADAVEALVAELARSVGRAG